MSLGSSSALGTASGAVSNALTLTSSSAQVDLNGFGANIDALTGSTGTVTDSGTSSTLTLGSNNGSGNFGGALTGALALTKTGTGLQTLSGASTYTGATTLNGGTTLINGTVNGTSAIAVNNGATLGGTGGITSSGGMTLATGGILAPGTTGIGTLTFTLGSTSQMNIGAAGTGDLLFTLGTPSSSDEIALTSGVLNIGTTLDVNDFSFTSSSNTLTPGTYILFATDTAIMGSLATANEMTTVDGMSAQLTLVDSRQDLALIVSPEPPSWLLLLGSLLIGLGLARRVRAAKSIFSLVSVK